MRPWARRAGAAFCSAAVAVVLTACDKNTDPVPIPTPVSPPTTTEVYTGTVSPGGSNLHFFQIQSNQVQVSEVRVTLTDLVAVAVDADPNATPPVEAAPATPLTTPVTVLIGQQALTTLGVQCASLKSVETPPGSAPQLTGQAIPGTYCVSVVDANTALPRAAKYTITVAHAG